jgi:hypothetical protein
MQKDLDLSEFVCSLPAEKLEAVREGLWVSWRPKESLHSSMNLCAQIRHVV